MGPGCRSDARSSRCWRTTSRPTAASSFRSRCGSTWASTGSRKEDFVQVVVRAEPHFVAVLEGGGEDARSVQPDAVAALEVLDHVAVRAAEDAGVEARDAGIGQANPVVAVAADEVFRLDDRNGRSVVCRAELRDDRLDDVVVRKLRLFGDEEARVVVAFLIANGRLAPEERRLRLTHRLVAEIGRAHVCTPVTFRN